MKPAQEQQIPIPEQYETVTKTIKVFERQMEWRRNTDGEMVVFVDGEEILRTVDRALQEHFDGFTMVNQGGDYTVSRIAAFGTEGNN